MPAMNIEQARFNMVENQIRPWDVLDQQVLDLLYVIKREDCVPAAYRMLAFSDMEIPIGQGEHMWQPKMEARVLQELALKPTDQVLEIGTGSGYFAALLAPWLALWLNRRRLRWSPALIGISGVLLAVTLIGFFDYYTWLLVPGRLWQWLIWGLWSAAFSNSLFGAMNV